MSGYVSPTLHEDADLFRAAVAFTEAETGFNARLVEQGLSIQIERNDRRDLAAVAIDQQPNFLRRHRRR